MAKPAKQIDEFTPKYINTVVEKVIDLHEQIASARGRFMVQAKRFREQMGEIYEQAASKGIPQNVMKLQVRVERDQEKLKGKIADLEIANRKMLQRIAKMRENKAQLALFGDLPAAPKPPKAAPKQMDLSEVTQTAGAA